MDACRAINEMVFAMLFIVAVGLGPFAGVLALFVHTTGTLSKLFSEAVEAIEPETGRALPIDTGFMVFNRVTYHLLCRLFDELQVPVKPTDMSFGVRDDATGTVFVGEGCWGAPLRTASDTKAYTRDAGSF
jgi:hypothetical protein